MRDSFKDAGWQNSMDEIDRSQETTEIYEQAAMQTLARRRAAYFQPVPGGRKWRECEDCGKPIPLARMKANPKATRCIKCQTNFESGGN